MVAVGKAGTKMDKGNWEFIRLRSGKLIRYRIYNDQGELFASVSGIGEALTIEEIEEVRTELNSRLRERQVTLRVESDEE